MACAHYVRTFFLLFFRCLLNKRMNNNQTHSWYEPTAVDTKSKRRPYTHTRTQAISCRWEIDSTRRRRRRRRIRRRKLVWKVVLRDYVVSGFELKFTNTFVRQMIDMCELYAMVCGQSADGSTASVVVIVRFIGHFMRCRWHSLRECVWCVCEFDSSSNPTSSTIHMSAWPIKIGNCVWAQGFSVFYQMLFSNGFFRHCRVTRTSSNHFLRLAYCEVNWKLNNYYNDVVDDERSIDWKVFCLFLWVTPKSIQTKIIANKYS